MPNELPIAAIPGSPETGFLGAAIVMSLLELLVEKKTITRGEVIFLLQSLKERVENDSRALAKPAAGTLDNWVYLQKGIQK